MPERYLTTAHAARVLGVSADAVAKAHERGKLVGRHFGPRLIVSEASVLAWRKQRIRTRPELVNTYKLPIDTLSSKVYTHRRRRKPLHPRKEVITVVAPTDAGSRLRQYLADHDLTQAWLADQTGYADEHVSRMLSGHNTLTHRFILAACAALRLADIGATGTNAPYELRDLCE